VRLVRHGQTEPNITAYYAGRSEDDLNETGYQQVRQLADRLASLPIAAIYSSPLPRTRRTAVILSEPHLPEYSELEELIEIDLGDWTGRYVAEIKQIWPELYQQWTLDPSEVTVPNGENLARVTERAVQGLVKTVAANRGREILLVTHDIVIKVLVIYALGATNHIYRHFDIGNASLSTIRYRNDRPHLISLNDTIHLND